MLTLERASTGKPVQIVSLVGILLVPIIVASGFLAALWHSDTRMHNVQAAVVNEDEMVEVNGQPVPLGRQLAAGLTERRDDNFTWILADAENAEQGLRTGRYAAVITIPEDFSARATSFSGEPGDARQATVDIRTSTTAGVADGTIARVIAETARTTLNTELTKQYLDGIYIGFNQMGDQFQTVADASRDLADGTTELSDGIGELSTGTDELATGVEQYADGVGEAATGAHELATGMNRLSTAGGELRTGGDKLAGSGGELASGANELAGGVGELRKGTRRLADQTRDLPDQTDQLATGIEDAAAGSDELADGLGQAKKQMPQLTSGTQQLADGAGELSTGLDQYVGGVNQLVDGLEPATSALGELSEEDIAELQTALVAMGQAQQGAQDAADQIEAFTRLDCPTVDDVTEEQQAAFCAQWQAAQAALTQPVGDTGMTATEWARAIADDERLGEASATAEALAPQLPKIVEQSGRLGELKTGGNQLASGAQQLADGTKELNDNVDTLATGIGDAADGSRELATGLDRAAGGTRQLADGMVPLSAGIQKLDGGVGELSTGADQLSSGIGQYTDGVSQYADGVSQYTDGVSQAATGTGELANGMDELATGGDELATGARELADGVVELDEGGEKLADGSTQLADGLDEGASKVPSYDKREREALSSAASAPVAGDEASASGLIPLATATSLLMVLALWLGALATYIVIAAVSRRVLTSTRPTWQLVGHALAPGVIIGAVQAVILTAIGQTVLDLSAAKVVEVFLLLMLGAGIFGSINHALTAWLGGAGRVISVAFVTLTAATNIMSAVPTWLGALAEFSPLAPVLTAVKIVVTDGTGLTAAVGACIGWLLVGTAASVVAVMRGQQATPEKLRLLASA